MRTGLFMVGVVLLILGAVLIVVPLLHSTSSFSSTSNDCTGGSCSLVTDVYTATPLIPTYAKLSWTSPSTVQFFAVTCTNDVSSSEVESANSSSKPS